MRSKPVLGLSLLLLIAWAAFMVTVKRRSADAPAEAFAERGKPLDTLWPMAPFAYVDQRGQTVTAASLKGKVWVANFIFTQCRTVCPLLTAKMVQLQRKLRGAEVRFVSFSVDPEHDTPAALAAYAQTWAPDEPRWTLLSTDDKTLPGFAAALHIVAQKGTDELNPIIHSGVFLLIDGEGVVRGAYDSEDRIDFGALESGVRTLAKAPFNPRELPATGEALYHELSCVGCHERAELAPLLTGLRGAKRELENGLLVTADEAYVAESIVAPEAKRVKGYPLRMPSYDGLITSTQLRPLVDYLLDRAAPAGATDAGATVETDPVCHMAVRVVADTPSATFDGGTFHFCSEHCRARFAATPGAFANAASDSPSH